MATIHQKLTKQEARNKKALAASVASLFLAHRSLPSILASVPILASSLQRSIASLHDPVKKLAHAYSDEQADDADQDDTDTVDVALTTAAALGIVGTVIGVTRGAMTEGEPFEDALETAVEATRARSDRIGTTETFDAFNKQVKADLASSVGVFRFDATLDKRTCPRCEGLNGKEWSNIDDVPFPPIHTSCRCLIEFDAE